MTEATKIYLSAKELELVLNKDWILTKQIVIEKICTLFARLSVSMQAHLQQTQLPATITHLNAKIAKGENYLGLPYVMLDYPRLFTREDTLAIRSFFWWGNHISITLQLSGKSRDLVAPQLLSHFTYLQARGYYVCTSEDAWQHHFDSTNYLPCSSINQTDFAQLLNREFVKIAARILLADWEKAPLFIEAEFKLLAGLLQVSFQGGETGLLPGIPTTGFGL